jgi:hypothetical protein
MESSITIQTSAKRFALVRNCTALCYNPVSGAGLRLQDSYYTEGASVCKGVGDIWPAPGSEPAMDRPGRK